MATPVRFSFALTRAEYLAGARTGPGRVVRVGAVVGAGVLAVGVAGGFEIVTAMGIMAVLVAALAWLLPWWQWTAEPALQAEETWTVDDDGCTIVRPDIETHVQWAFYRELVDAGRVFVLLGERGATDVVPKRAVPTEAFLEHVRAHVAVREATPATDAGWTD